MFYRRWLRKRKLFWEKKLCENLSDLYSRDTTLEENLRLMDERKKIGKKLCNLTCKLRTSEKRYLARL